MDTTEQVCGMALAVAEALSEQIDTEMGGPEDGLYEWTCLVDYGNDLYGVCWLGGGLETFDSAAEWESFKTRAGE